MAEGCRNCAALQDHVAQLKAENTELRKEIQQLKKLVLCYRQFTAALQKQLAEAAMMIREFIVAWSELVNWVVTSRKKHEKVLADAKAGRLPTPSGGLPPHKYKYHEGLYKAYGQVERWMQRQEQVYRLFRAPGVCNRTQEAADAKGCEG